MPADPFQIPVFLFEIVYFASMVFLSSLGLHRYRLCGLYLKARGKKPSECAPPPELPSVTVQLPVYNEQYVVERLIEAACSLDYPHHLLEIQVLDDSTDRTSEIAAETVRRKKAEGLSISHIRRETRRGYKAGALKDAAAKANGEITALFDADFVPPRDFLLRAVGSFSDPSVGIAQARWGHINLRQSLLTRLQSIFLDGHFLIEQTGRAAAGVFLNFNGTATLIRASCLSSCGGWQEDTVAEDLDLSCRAQLGGWKIKYLRDLVCPAELPPDVQAFKSQQSRWATGGIQNAFKFLGEIIRRKDLSAGFKTEAAFHMLGNLSSPFFLLAVFSAVVISVKGGTVPAPVYSVFGAAAFLASGGIFAFYTLCAFDSRGGENAIGRLLAVPLTVVLWAGMSVSNTRAVLRAVAGKRGEFVRTPKTASTGSLFKKAGVYGSRFDFSALVEFAFSVALAAIALRPGEKDAFLQTLLLVFSAAFFYVSTLSVKQHLQRFAGRS